MSLPQIPVARTPTDQLLTVLIGQLGELLVVLRERLPELGGTSAAEPGSTQPAPEPEPELEPEPTPVPVQEPAPARTPRTTRRPTRKPTTPAAA